MSVTREDFHFMLISRRFQQEHKVKDFFSSAVCHGLSSRATVEMKGNSSSTACLIKMFILTSLCRLHVWNVFFDVYIIDNTHISKTMYIQIPDISDWSKEPLTTAPDVADVSFGDLLNKKFIVLCDGISSAEVYKALR